jgi:phage/plasmid-like protein (TIGR03299 family)
VSHNLSICADGKAEMMYVGEMPWHGLGTKLAKPPTAEEAIRAAHLDWGVLKQQLYVGDEHRPLPGQYAIVREDRWARNEDAILGTVGQEYSPMQNSEAFRFFDPIIKTGDAFYESAGALKNGERVWVMAKLKDDIEIARDDNVARFLLLSNAHDGTGSVQVKFTPVRVVCRNTLNEALSRGPAIRVTHTRDMAVRVEDAAHVVLATIQQHFDDLGNSFRAMLEVQMSNASLNSYLKAIFHDPIRGKDERHYKRAVAQAQRDRVEAGRLFSGGKGNDLLGVRGSLWAAYNGVNEYVDFHRAAHRDSKWLENIWFGGASSIKERALDEALKLTRPN